MGIIAIEGMEFYAYHGCLVEEQKIGSKYTIDININTDFNKAAITDELQYTIDYARIYTLIKEEMNIPSKLIEHVAKRISGRIRATFSEVIKVEVKVTKHNPPVNGSMGKVSVLWKE